MKTSAQDASLKRVTAYREWSRCMLIAELLLEASQQHLGGDC